MCAGCVTCLAQMAICVSAQCLKNWGGKLLNGFCNILATTDTQCTPTHLRDSWPPNSLTKHRCQMTDLLLRTSATRGLQTPLQNTTAKVVLDGCSLRTGFHPAWNTILRSCWKNYFFKCSTSLHNILSSCILL